MKSFNQFSKEAFDADAESEKLQARREKEQERQREQRRKDKEQEMERKYITADDLEDAEDESAKSGESVGDILKRKKG